LLYTDVSHYTVRWAYLVVGAAVANWICGYSHESAIHILHENCSLIVSVRISPSQILCCEKSRPFCLAAIVY